VISEDAGFGEALASYVSNLRTQMENGGIDGPFGHVVASFVLQTNPGADKTPDHAGPPDNKSHNPSSTETDRSQPNNKTQGSPNNQTRGPPTDAGPDNDSQTGNNSGDVTPDRDHDRGPPEHAGPESGNDADQEDQKSNEDDGSEDEDTENHDDETDGTKGGPMERGPPSRAGLI
jgi:hypothetical protein